MRPHFRVISLSVFVVGVCGFAWVLNGQSGHPLDDLYTGYTGEKIQLTDPDTLVRRMSLQLRGTIPTISEVQSFSGDSASVQKAAADFIRDPDFAHYWGTYFASVFREHTDGRKEKYGSFLTYIAQSIHQNKPYDVWVREMLTATGSPDVNPAANLYLRDGADPLQVAEYVGRVFYGERVSCARCHDHPYIKFSRRDYYGLAAFFSQQFEVRKSWDPAAVPGAVPRELLDNLPEQDKKEMDDKLRQWQKDVGSKMSKEEREAYRKKHEVEFATLYYNPKLGVRFPKSDDAAGGDLVQPKFPDGTTPKIKPGEDRRVVFAAWLTDPKNERFRKVLINRIWTRLMGWSFFTPLDDWNENTKLEGEKILTHLDQVFIQSNYRIKDLVYYIVTSNAYARRAPPANMVQNSDKTNSTESREFFAQTANAKAAAYFQPVRLDPDQMMNSMLRGAGALEIKTGDLRERSVTFPNQTVNLAGKGSIASLEKGAKEYMNAFQVPRPSDDRTILAVFGSGDRMDVADDDRTITVEQVLTLINGRFTGRLSWDYGKKDTFIYKEYERTKDLNLVYDTIYMSLLSRRMKPNEKARFQAIASEKLPKEKGDYRPEVMSDLVWSIFNSQEFLHVR